MTLIDLLLNIAGLLLWLKWRSIRFDPLSRAAPATMVGTLRRAAPPRLKRWHLLVSLPALVVLRALLYWQIGPAVEWDPHLQFGAIAIWFRSDLFLRILAYSAVRLFLVLFWFYLCLLLISLVGGATAEPDPWQSLVRMHLGFVQRWPWPVKLSLPLLIGALFWLAVNPAFVALGILRPTVSGAHRIEQAVIIGLSAYLSWKYLIGAFLLLRLLSSYVYLGGNSFWKFVETIGRRLVAPLNWLPLRIAKVDFAPVVGIALVFLVSEFAQRGLTALYSRLPL
jgi:uncharacterized protein YggT (Ycf19 family)